MSSLKEKQFHKLRKIDRSSVTLDVGVIACVDMFYIYESTTGSHFSRCFHGTGRSTHFCFELECHTRARTHICIHTVPH